MQLEKEHKTKLNKTEEAILKQLEYGENPEIVENPYSGVKVFLSPKAVALYDYIKGLEYLYSKGQLKSTKDFDNARMLFAKLYPESYMHLLD